MTIKEFKEKIAEINKREDVHVKVLSRKLGKAIEAGKLNCTWFNNGDSLAEITDKTKSRKISLYVKGDFSGELMNASSGECIISCKGSFQEMDHPISVHSDKELDPLLDEGYKGHYIQYIEPVCIEATDGNITVGYKSLSCVDAILDVDFFIQEFNRIEKNHGNKGEEKGEELAALLSECKNFIHLAKESFGKATQYIEEAEIRLEKIEMFKN